jgi:hypothetical protein
LSAQSSVAPRTAELGDNSLAGVAEELKREYRMVVSASSGIVERAIKFGELLNSHKAKFIKETKWLPFLEKHFDKFGVRTCQRCMKLAKPESQQKIKDHLRNLPPEDALKFSLNKAFALLKDKTSKKKETHVSEKYDAVEKKLLELLAGLKFNEVEAYGSETIGKVNAAIDDAKRKANPT